MARLLLLISSTSYRISDFLKAAHRAGVDVTVGSDQEQILQSISESHTTTVNFLDKIKGVEDILNFSVKYPITTIIATDENTGAIAAEASYKLKLPYNSTEATAIAGNKL